MAHAHTFQEALELAAQSPYHLALIEMSLPDATGSDAWQVLKELQPQLLEILITASRSLYRSIVVEDPRILAYMFKPYRLELVVLALEQVVRETGSRRALRPGQA